MLKKLLNFAKPSSFRADESIRKNESLALRAAIFESALECIIMIDHHGLILEFNPAAEAVFGYPRAEVLGENIAEVIIPLSLRDQHRRGLARYLSTGEGPVLGKQVELTGLRADGTEFPIELVVTPISGETPPVFIGFLRDITERKRTGEALKQRAAQFEAIAEVARTIVSSQDMETLLPQITRFVSEKFGFYHVGIFLLDENREYAVLNAANSEGGKRMLHRGHKLKIGQTGIVGYVAATGAPRITLDVETDTAFFNNPDLPETRSEMALPLKVADEIIGVLDVQSVEPNAFQQEDAEVLSTLADQVAIAIQNARSYGTMQELLKEAQKTSGTYLGDSWHALRSQEQHIGYIVSEDTLKPLSKPVTSAKADRAIANKETVIENGISASITVPIRLRNEVIGVMDICVPEEHEWDPDEVDIVEAVAERLSLALETSLLVRTTQRRAEIERLTADISGKISAATQFDSILRTTTEELSHALGGSEVLVQIQIPESDGFDDKELSKRQENRKGLHQLNET
jgi:PAS domain S-box-containing protein